MSAQRPHVLVRSYMTPAPHTIAPQQTLADAHALMRDHRIRHLPVLRDGRVVGIVSQRDLMVLETLPDVNPAEVAVEDAMSRDVFAVAPRTPLAKVATEMADRRFGCAVVVDGDRVIGMFTVTDACLALARLMPQTHRRTRPAARKPLAATARRRVG
jgi:acetoin utilization protein AcuB